MRWFDHELLRHVWTNEAEIAPGVRRSNQPTRARLARLRDRGVRTVLSLRSAGGAPHFSLVKHCGELGLELHVIPLSSRHAPERDSLIALIDLFRRLERPFVMHCKSGADRAGLAAAIYLMAIDGRGVDDARRMLSLRFLHLKWGRAGILGRLLDAYARDATGRTFEDWVRYAYDPAGLV